MRLTCMWTVVCGAHRPIHQMWITRISINWTTCVFCYYYLQMISNFKKIGEKYWFEIKRTFCKNGVKQLDCSGEAVCKVCCTFYPVKMQMCLILFDSTSIKEKSKKKWKTQWLSLAFFGSPSVSLSGSLWLSLTLSGSLSLRIWSQRPCSCSASKVIYVHSLQKKMIMISLMVTMFTMMNMRMVERLYSEQCNPLEWVSDSSPTLPTFGFKALIKMQNLHFGGWWGAGLDLERRLYLIFQK